MLVVRPRAGRVRPSRSAPRPRSEAPSCDPTGGRRGGRQGQGHERGDGPRLFGPDQRLGQLLLRRPARRQLLGRRRVRRLQVGATYSKVVLNVADVREFNIKLETGAITESVSVEVPAVSAKTVGGDVSGLITGTAGPRAAAQRPQLPAARPPDAGRERARRLNVKDKGLLGGSDLSVSGSATTANLWTVDGANNNDVGSNRTILVYPSVEAIEEFKIHSERATAPSSARRAGGPDQHRHPRRHERVPRQRLLLRPQRRAERHQLLPRAGGQGRRTSSSATTSAGPSAARSSRTSCTSSPPRSGTTRRGARCAPPSCPRRPSVSGDFSGSRHRRLHAGRLRSTPLTGAPFPGNSIPADRLSPGGHGLPAALPAAQHHARCAGAATTGSARSTRPSTGGRRTSALDYSLHQHHPPDAALHPGQLDEQRAQPSPERSLGRRSVPGRGLELGPAGKSFMAQLTHNVGSKGVNTLSFSYSDNSITVTGARGSPG